MHPPGGAFRLNPCARAMRGVGPCFAMRAFASRKEFPMQDLLWIAAMAGLVAATLAYVRLCDKA
ncbi:hypothetical protein [Sphingomonas sp. NFR15]|uniref:hypothetical protein n=1 Tax=Sphingomonas sp. NFR15 TaxID=1566282 RepID=UPI000B82B13C|nr:hypothetical protein [Sphingomonas sp. NFR15]